MKITPYQNNNQPNFKGIYKFRVPKGLFSDPKTALETFKAMLPGNKQKVKNSPLNLILVLLGLKKLKATSCSFLENPLYLDFLKHAQEVGADLTWVKQHFEKLSCPVELPEDKKVFDFFVFTKEDKDRAINVLSIKTIIRESMKIQAFSLKAQKCNRDFAPRDTKIIISALLGKNLMTKIMTREPDRIFEVNTLEALPEAFKQLDWN